MKVVVVGLNPAWQQTLQFTSLQLGEVNRAQSIEAFASGKGINVAQLLRKWGHEVLLIQILGGKRGEQIEKYCLKIGIETLSVWSKNETRICNTLIDEGQQSVTELIEPYTVEPNLEERFYDSLPKSIQSDALVFCGTAPSGLSQAVFPTISKAIASDFTLVDSYKNLSIQWLQTVDCVKINLEEYSVLYPQLMESSKHLNTLKLPILCVTAGKYAAQYLQWTGSEYVPITIIIPEIAPIKNSIGAGDTVCAAMIDAHLRGRLSQDGFLEGLAMASASCLSLRPCEYAEKDFADQLKKIQELNPTFSKV